jgi:hypothetical protein
VGANQIGHHIINYESTIPGRVQDIYAIPWTGLIADFGLVGFCLIIAVWLFSFQALIGAWTMPGKNHWAPVLCFVLFSRVISLFLTGSFVEPTLWLTIAAVVACVYGTADGHQITTATERNTVS